MILRGKASLFCPGRRENSLPTGGMVIGGAKSRSEVDFPVENSAGFGKWLHPSSVSVLSASSLFLFALCLLVSFLYAGIEAGLLSLSRARLRSRIHRGERSAVRLGKLLSHPGRLLATVLLVTNFADVAALVLFTDACVRWFGVGRGYVIGGLVLLPVYLLGVQLLPKSLFQRFPYRATVALAGLLEVTSRLLWPVLSAGKLLAGRVFLPPVLPPGAGARGVFATRQDFKGLAAEGEKTGALTPAEHRLIVNVVDFTALRALDLGEPLPEGFRLVGDPESATVADLLAFARERDMDFLPVFGEGGELLALLDVFALWLERDPRRPVTAYLRRMPLVVSSDTSAWQALRRLRALRLGAAAVGDADGRPVSLVRTGELLQRLARGQTD